jgi:GNAT superfamily N-acetyltransferase
VVEASARQPGPGAAETTSRLVLLLFRWEEVIAIVERRRLGAWASDYPAEGDVVIAGILHRAGPPDGTGPAETWSHRQIRERESGLVVGGIGYFGPPRSGEVEIGYGIVPSHQGRGYATEAVRAMTSWAKTDATVTTVVAGTDPDNPASQRVLEKVGFRCVERAALWHWALDVSS